ncbi:MAG: hypothetical protein ACM3VV_01470 [Deltaproteobacteria bacterium]
MNKFSGFELSVLEKNRLINDSLFSQLSANPWTSQLANNKKIENNNELNGIKY